MSGCLQHTKFHPYWISRFVSAHAHLMNEAAIEAQTERRKLSHVSRLSRDTIKTTTLTKKQDEQKMMWLDCSGRINDGNNKRTRIRCRKWQADFVKLHDNLTAEETLSLIFVWSYCGSYYLVYCYLIISVLLNSRSLHKTLLCNPLFSRQPLVLPTFLFIHSMATGCATLTRKDVWYFSIKAVFFVAC